VRLRSLVRSWNEFFFAPQSPTPIALYRILYGLLVIADVVLMRPDWQTWFGWKGFVPIETMRAMAAGARINLFAWLPRTDAAVDALFWLLLAAAISLTLGFMSRLSAVAVFVGLVSLHQRNLFILHSGDTLMRVCGFFLMFAPCGAAISVDRLLRIWRGREGAEPRPRAPWAQRLIQLQVAIAYVATFWWKSQGSMWMDGTAVYYSSRLLEFKRFPAPEISSLFVAKLMTWSTLAIECALGTLIWIRELRYWILLAGLGLHLSIEYSMNVPLFQWIAVASYVTFIYPADLTRFWSWVRGRVAPRLGAPVPVAYDGGSERAVRHAQLLRAIDILGRLELFDARLTETKEAWPELAGGVARGRLVVGGEAGWLGGFAGLRAISTRIPLLWPMAPLAIAAAQPKQSLRAARAAK
jgi:hypothetical protein